MGPASVLRSSNDVILTAGQHGVLSTDFFTKVMWVGPPAKALWGHGQDFTDLALEDVYGSSTEVYTYIDKCVKHV